MCGWVYIYKDIFMCMCIYIYIYMTEIFLGAGAADRLPVSALCIAPGPPAPEVLPGNARPATPFGMVSPKPQTLGFLAPALRFS